MALIPFSGAPSMRDIPIDDEQQEEEDLRDKYQFEMDEMVNAFNDEPPVLHDVYPESDDDGKKSKRKRAPYVSYRRGSAVLFVGQTFFNCQGFKETVLNHALKEGRNIKQVRWDTTKCAFECVGGNCNWRVYCSVKKKTSMWEVKIYNGNHSCVPNGECEMLKITVIARLFVDKIRYDPEHFKPAVIEEMIKEKWKLVASRDQCQHARNKALRWIEKEHDEEFARLRDYRAELLNSNPYSSVHVETIRNEAGLDVFDRFYVCFDVLKRTWKQCCRRLIGVDGCHLRGKMKGQFLVALGRDGDNAIYPIAWAVVQIENTPNWVWFIQKIKEDLELAEGDGYVLVSDRQKGLLTAVEKELPEIEHRMCVRHIYANLKARHGRIPELKPLVWTLAWSYNEADYRDNLKRIMRFDRGVYEDVMKMKPTTWCRAFFKLGSFCEDVENNSTESFNATIVKAREKPLVPMLELVARLAMVRIFKRSVVSADHEPLITPYAKQFLAREHGEAANCRVLRSTNNMFQVVCGSDCYRVSLESRTCTCRKWDLTGIPCEHAYGVILQRNLEVEDYVINWFYTERWRRTYREGIVPIQGSKYWPTGGSVVHKPPVPPQTGRKKLSKKDKQRKKGVNESPTKKRPSNGVNASTTEQRPNNSESTTEQPPKKQRRCGVCGEEGHNARSHKRNSEANGESQEASLALVTVQIQQFEGHVTDQMHQSQGAVSEEIRPSQMQPSQASQEASQSSRVLDDLFSFTRVM